MKFERYGEEIDDLIAKKINYIKNVALTNFSFDRNYIDFRNRRLVTVAPAVGSNDCVIKKQLEELENSLERIRNLRETRQKNDEKKKKQKKHVRRGADLWINYFIILVGNNSLKLKLCNDNFFFRIRHLFSLNY